MEEDDSACTLPLPTALLWPKAVLLVSVLERKVLLFLVNVAGYKDSLAEFVNFACSLQKWVRDKHSDRLCGSNVLRRFPTFCSWETRGTEGTSTAGLALWTSRHARPGILLNTPDSKGLVLECYPSPSSCLGHPVTWLHHPTGMRGSAAAVVLLTQLSQRE